jgi:type II secretory ATPase GspE/PulE/Tfp pilus assembly ATPase PilB-like protein
MLRLTSPVQHLLEQAAPRALIQECARDAGMRLLHEHGLVKASHGLTCLDELTKLRAIMEDQADPISTRAAA